MKCDNVDNSTPSIDKRVSDALDAVWDEFGEAIIEEHLKEVPYWHEVIKHYKKEASDKTIRSAMESVVPEKLIFDFFPDENDMDAGNFHHYRGKVAGYNQAINNMKANIKKYLEGGGDTDG